MAEAVPMYGAGQTMRLDRFLWFARIVKTRSFAQALAERGRMRIDGRPIDRAAAPVRVGNILTFVTHRGDVRTIRVEALPIRRGPPSEAQNCYADLLVGDDGTGPLPHATSHGMP